RAGTLDDVQAGRASSLFWGGMPFTYAQAAAVVMVALGVAMMFRFASLALRRAEEGAGT
ncbi:MAG: hypothetical protein IIC73_09020, partial [Armatimonadetes bacterium]|nr:hypothetical protein [Armatimonadota bacterium]